MSSHNDPHMTELPSFFPPIETVATADDIACAASSVDDALRNLQEVLENAPADPRMGLAVQQIAMATAWLSHACASLATLKNQENPNR